MPGAPEGLPRLYTAAEVAAAMQCSTWWVQEQVRRRRFPHEEIAGSCRFTVEQYTAILRLCAVLPREARPAAEPSRSAGPVSESSASDLTPKVPRRLRGLPPIDVAA